MILIRIQLASCQPGKETLCDFGAELTEVDINSRLQLLAAQLRRFSLS